MAIKTLCSQKVFFFFCLVEDLVLSEWPAKAPVLGVRKDLALVL